MLEFLSIPAEAGKVVEVEHVEPGGDVFAVFAGSRLILVHPLPLLDRGGGAAVHVVGPSVDFLAGAGVLLVFFDPREDGTVTQTGGDLFLQGFRIHPGKFEEILVQGAVEIVVPVFAGKGGAAFIENPWEDDITPQADAGTTGGVRGEVCCEGHRGRMHQAVFWARGPEEGLIQ